MEARQDYIRSRYGWNFDLQENLQKDGADLDERELRTLTEASVILGRMGEHLRRGLSQSANRSPLQGRRLMDDGSSYASKFGVEVLSIGADPGR
ncbi:hypothetical protein [Muricoccus aerilatus]|uniref:hypothetical protein n=1 Tax=Muricoccus aerilatus TaxID=452982 RepID=UPI0005C1FFEA|nr:hypothetical protein [Roseomonas aerilata]